MADDDATALIDDLTSVLATAGVDYTLFFRHLTTAAAGDAGPVRELFDQPAAGDPGVFESPGALQPWLQRWLAYQPDAQVMARTNPVYIPRNHLVQEALDAATTGDLDPFEQILAVVRNPFTARDGLQRYEEPAPAQSPPFVTYCGT